VIAAIALIALLVLALLYVYLRAGTL